MASVTNAISSLATFAAGVPGIVHSYDLNAVPESVSRDKLPAALVIPEGTDIGFKTLGSLGGAPIFEFSVIQLILVAPAESIDFRKAVPGLITLLDAYLVALKASPFLGSTAAPPIHEATSVVPTIGITKYGGVDYHSIAFKHTLKIYL
jgi:hypothetical protein